jgi:hypothetical protein
MDPNHRDHLQQSIDSQINSLKESIRESVRALSQRRNELAPISSLPTEIIADIIMLASAKRNDPGMPWLNVAHVCRQWRDIALNKRLFWSHINFTNLTSAGAAEILARAKEAPLHLKLDSEARFFGRPRWDDARYSAFVKELQAHVSHIRHLDISIGTRHLLRTAFQHTLVASPAPMLEHLSLSILSVPPYEVFYLPNNVFKGTTPRLFSLELQEVAISWTSPLLRGLKYLKVHKPNNNDMLSITEWLDALDEMPQLKELVLYAASPLDDGFTFLSDIKRTATLPVLTHLDLSSTAGACAIALAHLVLPALTCLVLQARSSDYRGHDALILFRYVTQHAHGPQDARPLQSVFLLSDGARTCIVAWPTGMPDIYDWDAEYRWPLWLPGLSTVAQRTARVMLTFTCVTSDSWYTSAYVQVLDAVIEALPLDGLVTLAAHNCVRLDEQVWLRHAPRWPLLEHVQLAPRAARGLREMLLLEDKGGHEGPLLPSLTKLVLVDGTSLSKRRTLRLCNALKKRVEQGVPLKVLELRTSCKWTIGAVQLLRTFVADIQGAKGQTLFQVEGPQGLVVDPETCHFADGYDGDSDEEKEGWDDEDVEEGDDGEEEEEGEE